MNARFVLYYISRLRIVVVLLFFVFSSLTLPNNVELFHYLQAVEPSNDELEKLDDLTQNKDGAKHTDSIDSKESQVCSLRLVRNGKTPTQLETSVVRFQGDFLDSEGGSHPVVVDLIGTIHFAEPSYYEELNRIFQEYDVVVFEMVTPAGTDVGKLLQKEREDKASRKKSILNVVSFTQQTLADALGFSYQIEGIDYAATNLKRGDADVEEFLLQILANDDLTKFGVSSFFSALLNQSQGELEGWAFALLCASNRRVVARRLMALDLESSNVGEFERAEVDETTLEEPSENDALVAFRNQKALGVARRELNKGKTKLAIFYGAAHMPDFARRLEKDFRLKRTSETRWIPAWNMEKQ